MSQNFGNSNNPSSGGAGTGATDAGTTRDKSASTGTSYGSTGSTSTGSTGGSSTGSTGGGSTGAGGGSLSTTGTGGGAATGAAAARDAAGGITQTAQEYGQKIADAASQAKDYMSDKLTPAVDKFNELRQKEYGEIANDAKEYARQNPGQAILISAAAGFLLGLLLRSTTRR